MMALAAGVAVLAATFGFASAVPTYPLFAISNKPIASDWTDADVAIVANTFTAADGVPEDLPLLHRLSKANPSFRSLRYCNPRGIPLSGPGRMSMTLEEFETSHRAEATFYTAGFVASNLKSTATELKLAHPLAPGGDVRGDNHCALRDWLLVPSDPRSGNVSVIRPNGKEVAFVTYVLVDDEIMKIVSITGDTSRGSGQKPFDDDPPPPATVTVIRGFAGTAAVAHAAGARVLSPVSLDDGVSASNTKLQWAVAMSSPLAAQLLVNNTLADVAAGYTGSWYDNFGASLFNAKTTTGCALRTVELFDPAADVVKLSASARDGRSSRPSTSGGAVRLSSPAFLAAQERRFAASRAVVERALGRSTSNPVPVLANGYGGVSFPDGDCQAAGACATLNNVSSAFRAGFVDGWILEGFFGNEVFSSGGCGSGGTVVVHEADQWVRNVVAVAWAAQNNIPVYPIIFQAGCKSPTLERLPFGVRSALEQSAYASFLLAVESANASTEYSSSSAAASSSVASRLAFVRDCPWHNLTLPTCVLCCGYVRVVLYPRCRHMMFCLSYTMSLTFTFELRAKRQD